MEIKSKTKLLVGILVIASLLFVGKVSAVGSIYDANLTLTFPSASYVISNATTNLVLTIDDLGGVDNYSLANVYAKSLITNATSWIRIATNEANDSTTNFYMQFNSFMLEDGNDYTFNATVFNGTDYILVSNLNIVVDNTLPDAPTISSPARYTTVSSTGTQTFTCAVNNTETTSCTYKIGRSGFNNDLTSTTGTYATNTCTFTKAFSSTADNGEWYWQCTASDGSNTTVSSADGLLVMAMPGSGGGYTPTIGEGILGITEEEGISTGAIIVVILLIGIGIYWYIGKK